MVRNGKRDHNAWKQHAGLLVVLLGLMFLVPGEESQDGQVPYRAVAAQEGVSAATPSQTPLTPISAFPAPFSASQAPSGKTAYLEVLEGCGPDLSGHCIYAYSGPGVEYSRVYELQKGMVFKIKESVERNGQVWYRIHFDEWLRYPERVRGDWYIPGVSGRVVYDEGVKTLSKDTPKTNKRIVVDLSEHMLYAYDGDREFMRTKVATGMELTPTPTGTFTIYKKTPTRYMQGPIPGITDGEFDAPGTPWNLYFTQQGAVIHGSYWHDRYGNERSNGCINLPPELSKLVYDWADVGTTVTVKN